MLNRCLLSWLAGSICYDSRLETSYARIYATPEFFAMVNWAGQSSVSCNLGRDDMSRKIFWDQESFCLFRNMQYFRRAGSVSRVISILRHRSCQPTDATFAALPALRWAKPWHEKIKISNSMKDVQNEMVKNVSCLHQPEHTPYCDTFALSWRIAAKKSIWYHKGPGEKNVCAGGYTLCTSIGNAFESFLYRNHGQSLWKHFCDKGFVE